MKQKMLFKLTPGTLFKFDKDGDVIFRFVEFIHKRAWFHGLHTDKPATSFSQIENGKVFVLDTMPDEYNDTMKAEFLEAAKKQISSKLNIWELSLLRVVFCNEPMNFEALQSQQRDQPDICNDMIGIEASTILSHVQP